MNIPSPIQFLTRFDNGIELFLKREDAIHNDFGGNKWRKLKHNLLHFQDNKYQTLITFGGPFSNHIAATASICNFHKIKSVGIIRGTYCDDYNPTMQRAISNGMDIYHIAKSEYNLKEKSDESKAICEQYPRPYIIPEGGSNLLAKLGLEEMMTELKEQGKFDYIFVASGTGMTASGIVEYADENQEVKIINVLKNPELVETISSEISSIRGIWKVVNNYHFGGYAKVSNQLQSFASMFYKDYQIPLDPIYNAKMMFAVWDMIAKNEVRPNSKILAIHTGGLQGIQAYEYVTGKSWLSS